MTKYINYRRDDESERIKKNSIHPVWRGVGFILMFLIPFLAYFGAKALLEMNQVEKWVSIPADLLAPGSDPLLYVRIGIAVVLALFLFLIIQLITFIIFGAFGSSYYGPTDAPRQIYKGKKSSRY